MAATLLSGRDLRVNGADIGGVCYAGQEAEFLFGRGTQLFPNLPVEVWGVQTSRVVEDAGEKWFEFGFRIDTQLTGNSAAGWMDAGNYIRLEPQWSDDLVTWQMGKFLPAPVPVVEVEPGVWEYWSRAINPVDSAVKTGQLSAGFPAGAGDSRNNPFTSLTIAGVVQALPHFPYTMPTDAAILQADIIAAGWPGTTVTAASDTEWAVLIPDVNLTLYIQETSIGWPEYLMPDMDGNLTIPVAGIDFDGAWVDGGGTPLANKGFGRLKLSQGPRYDAYL